MLISISTGSCGKGLHPAFLKLSKETSGKALLFRNATEMEKLANVIEETLKGSTTISSGSYGSSLTIRDKRSSERESRYRFPVDDSMETLIVYVTTSRETYGLYNWHIDLGTLFRRYKNSILLVFTSTGNSTAERRPETNEREVNEKDSSTQDTPQNFEHVNGTDVLSLLVFLVNTLSFVPSLH